LRKTPVPLVNKNDGTLRFKHKYIRSDSDTDEYTRLEYDVSMKKDSYIILDDESLGIKSVSCSSQWLNISFQPNARVPPHLVTGTSILVHGSALWGCLNERGQEGTIFKRISRKVAQYQTSDSKVLAFDAKDCSPLNFFGNATVSFFTNHSLIDVNDLKRRVRSMGRDVDETKSARANLRGTEWPDDKSKMGYGNYFDLFNWNYDPSVEGAVEPSMTVSAPGAIFFSF
jgi:hypothetical protein